MCLGFREGKVGWRDEGGEMKVDWMAESLEDGGD
jgi:hypothetical protein